MNQTTKKQIDFELERLKERTGLRLTLDHSYGRYRLEEYVGDSGGVSDLSYPLSKGQLYEMLYAMNKVFDSIDRKKLKEVSA